MVRSLDMNFIGKIVAVIGIITLGDLANNQNVSPEEVFLFRFKNMLYHSGVVKFVVYVCHLLLKYN